MPIFEAAFFLIVSFLLRQFGVLKAEVDRYNNCQVHSTTGEIPNIRFQKARNQGNSLFRKFTLLEPYRSPKDVFCLRASRMVNAYRRISLFTHEIEVPSVPLRVDVDVHWYRTSPGN
jgi:hypothetical protein